MKHLMNTSALKPLFITVKLSLMNRGIVFALFSLITFSSCCVTGYCQMDEYPKQEKVIDKSK